MKWISLAALFTALTFAADVHFLRMQSVPDEQIVHRDQPAYPPEALDHRIQGVVKISIRIGTDGRVEQAHLISGHPLLAPAAVQAARRWVFKPFESGGKPARVITQIEIPFTLPTQ
jgi:periplasmic protein TonB